MAQSLSQLYAHLVFSTQNREPLLAEEDRAALHSYIGGIVSQRDGVLLCAGSVSDHIHLLVALPRATSPADLVKAIKTISAAWLKKRSPRYARFGWQTGYGLFSISPSHRTRLEAYIRNQAEHHRAEDFQTEFVRFLKKYSINYDPNYLWS